MEEPLPLYIGLFLLRGHARMPMLLFTVAWDELAVAFSASEATSLLLLNWVVFAISFLLGALDYLSELGKFEAVLGALFSELCLQWFGFMGKRRGFFF